MPRPKRKITYQPDREHNPDKIKIRYGQLDWTSFGQMPVPVYTEEFALYADRLMKLVEKVLATEKVPLEHLKNVSQHLRRFSLEQRSFLKDDEFRCILWVLRSRVDWILHQTEKKDYSGHFKDLHDLTKQQLLISKKSVSSFDLKTFWGSLQNLISKINFIKYNKTLEWYVQCLYLRNATFLIRSSPKADVMNDPTYCTKLEDNGEYCCNTEHILQTDRIFSALFRMFELKSIVPVAMIAEPLQHKRRDALYKWLVSGVKGPHHNFIDRDYNDKIFGWYVLPGEADRFRSEERFIECTPQAIISKHRQAHIDVILHKMDKHTYLQDFLAYLKPTKKEGDVDDEDYYELSYLVPPPEINQDVDQLFLITASYLLSATFEFPLEAYIKRQEQVHFPWRKNYTPLDPTPYMIQIFQEFHVLLPNGSILQCPDIQTCFYQWLRRMALVQDIRENKYSKDDIRAIELAGRNLWGANWKDEQVDMQVEVKEKEKAPAGFVDIPMKF